jgi:hypothetical protein
VALCSSGMSASFLSRQRIEECAGRRVAGLLARPGLPAPDHRIDIPGIEFHPIADPAGALSARWSRVGQVAGTSSGIVRSNLTQLLVRPLTETGKTIHNSTRDEYGDECDQWGTQACLEAHQRAARATAWDAAMSVVSEPVCRQAAWPGTGLLFPELSAARLRIPQSGGRHAQTPPTSRTRPSRPPVTGPTGSAGIPEVIRRKPRC